MVAIDEKLKRMPRTVRVGVVPGGLSEFITIQAAIDWCNTQAVPAPSAAAPYTVEIWPGIYDEQVTMATFVYLRGIGPKGSVVIYQDDDDAFPTPGAGTFQVQNLTVRLGTPSAARRLIRAAGSPTTIRLSDIVFEVTTPGNRVIEIFDFPGVVTGIIERCSFSIDGTGASVTLVAPANTVIVHLVDNDFEWLNANAHHIESDVAGNDITGKGNRWAGTCAMFDCTDGDITLDNDIVVCPAANTVIAGTAIVLLRKGESTFEVIEGMSIQDAVDALPAGGGKVLLREAVFTADAAQIARAIDDVTIIGQGVNSRVELDGVTPVISAGGQDGWILADFDVDAGLVEIQFATNSRQLVTVNGLWAGVINPDLGQTNFAGQPIARYEEDRPIDPVLPIRKDYTKREYQAQNPTFANPQFIMELLRRQARYMHVPINDLWIDNSTGGTSTLFTQYAELACAAAGGQDGLVHCTAAFLNSYVDATVWDRVDFDNMFIWAFDVSRGTGSEADIRGRVQLKQANAEGVLANDGMGIEIQNLSIFGEAFAGAPGTVDLGVLMTTLLTYRIAIVLIPNVSVDFYVNEVYRGQITAQVPTGPAAGTCYWVLSIDNGAVATACQLRVSPISYWNHL